MKNNLIPYTEIIQADYFLQIKHYTIKKRIHLCIWNVSHRQCISFTFKAKADFFPNYYIFIAFGWYSHLSSKQTIFPLKTNICDLHHHKVEIMSITEPFAQEW